MSLYRGQSHLCLIPPLGSDPDILVLRGYHVSENFFIISVCEAISSSWLCICILAIVD